MLLVASPAFADKQSYCAAYATDFANAQTQDKKLWQHKYDIALKSCVSVANPDVVEEAPQQKKIKKLQSVTQQTAEVVPPEPAMATAKLEQGSDAWNEYCAKKYVSFDIKTGLYHSLTGVDRKCVVTKP